MIAWLVETLIATSCLLLLVLALRDPVRQTFGAKAAYALWLLPALRMVMPPLAWFLPQTLPIAGIAPTSGPISQLIRESVLHLDVAPALPGGAQAGLSWPLVLAGLWLLGAAIFALWQFLAYQLFCRRILSGARIRRSPAKGIKLLASPRASGPMAFGIMRRVIVFPQDALIRFDVEEHAMALAHELAHHRRGDLVANAFALGFLALHWCNPIAWYAHRAFRTDQEMACDADVIDAIRDRGLGHAYGRALVKCASGRELSAICHLTTVDRLKRRLSMLSKRSPSTRRHLAGLALTGAVVLSGLVLTASGEGMAAQVGAKVSNALPIPFKPGMLPSLPTVPSAFAAVDDEAQADADVRQAERDTRAAERQARVAERQARLAALSADRASQDAWDVPTPPTPPAPPAPPAAPALAAVPASPALAAVPAPPAAPAPPVPPRLRNGQRQIVIDDYSRYVPSQAEIDAMVPIVEVTEGNGCAGSRRFVKTSETTVNVDGRSRKKINIRICGKDIERQARMEAVRGLQEARNDIARERDLSDRLRSKIMNDLDRQIEHLRDERD